MGLVLLYAQFELEVGLKLCVIYMF
jgi:hypothetical protein